MDREYAAPLHVASIAETACMSPAHFTRRFREAYGETPHAYLMTRRLERAAALLRRGDVPVTQAALAAGWSSLGSFSNRFSELLGEPPSSYRARSQDGLRALAPCLAMVLGRPRRRIEQERRSDARGASRRVEG